MRKEATSTHAAPLKRSRINERKAATTAITTPRSKAPRAQYAMHSKSSSTPLSKSVDQSHRQSQPSRIPNHQIRF